MKIKLNLLQILNVSCVELNVANVQAMNATVVCVTDDLVVCSNIVTVGLPPNVPTVFKFEIKENRMLGFIWKEVQNYIPITYNISFKINDQNYVSTIIYL